MEEADQGGGGVTFPGSVQETTGHGIHCYGFDNRVVVLSKVGLDYHGVFSNHTDSITKHLRKREAPRRVRII